MKQRVVMPSAKGKRLTVNEALKSAMFEGDTLRKQISQQQIDPAEPTHRDPEEAWQSLGRFLGLSIMLKFVEGSHVRRRDEQFIVDPTYASPYDDLLLERARTSEDRVHRDLDHIDTQLARFDNIVVSRAFSADEDLLMEEKALAEEAADEEMADLNLYYAIHVQDEDRDTAAERAIDLVRGLQQYRCVETVYFQPMALPAASDISPKTGDLTDRQDFHRSAPFGVDAEFAAKIPGADGRGIRVADIENAWIKDHEDLPSIWWDASGINTGDSDHGTATLGVIAAQRNKYGVNGLAPKASVGICTTIRFACSPVPDAINEAARKIGRHHVLLIEQHYPGPTSDCWDMVVNKSQKGFVPVEHRQGDYDAIRRATALGVIVIEPAGNGGVDLDHSRYQKRFDPKVRDSGAVMVGAGSSHARRRPMSFTNYGRRVDVHAWGENVTTCGYGGVRYNGGDKRQWYTHTYAGTSSASAIMAGAATSLQGMLRDLGKPLLTPAQMRTMLRKTGTPQAETSEQIGPLVNLRDLFHAIGGKATHTIWNRKWSTGWSTFVPFELDGVPHILAYEKTTGMVNINSVNSDGKGLKGVWSDRWTDGWTHFTPVTLGDAPYIHAYKANRGDMVIDKVKADGQGVVTLWRQKWSRDFTGFMSFELKGRAYILMYKRKSGESRIERMKTDGTGFDSMWKGKLPAGCTAFMPYTLGQTVYFTAYNAVSGVVTFNRVRTGGKGITTTNTEGWTGKWSTFMPFELDEHPHCLLYKTHSGRAIIERLDENGQTSTSLLERKWTTGWTHFAPFTLNPTSHVMMYEPGHGSVAMEEVEPNGKYMSAIWKAGWSRGWSHMAPFIMDRKLYFYLYKQGDGTATIEQVPFDAKGCSSIWRRKLARGWSSIMPFSLGADVFQLSYNRRTGRVEINKFRDQGRGQDRVWTSRWSTGWNHFAPLTIDGKPHYVAYKPGAGTVTLDRIKPHGKGVDTIWRDLWIGTWTHIRSFTSNGQPQLLVHNNKTGAIIVLGIRAGGKGVTMRYTGTIDKGWQRIVPFYLHGIPVLLAFDRHSRNMAWYRIQEGSQWFTQMWKRQWSDRNTLFTPFTIPTPPHFLAYKEARGNAIISTVLG